MVVQVVMQVMLKGSIKTILDLFMTLQLLVYVTIFNLRIPALAVMVLTEIKKLIEFEALNIVNFIKMINPEFSIEEWISGVKE